jgi:ketosteroid isomerase-like protein
MSRENVGIVRWIYDAYARHDAETTLALYHAAVEFDLTMAPLWDDPTHQRRVHRGHDGLRGVFRDWREVWEDLHEDLEELIEAGDQVIDRDEPCARAGQRRAGRANALRRRMDNPRRQDRAGRFL